MTEAIVFRLSVREDGSYDLGTDLALSETARQMRNIADHLAAQESEHD